MKVEAEDDRDVSMSPVQSEIDELLPSEYVFFVDPLWSSVFDRRESVMMISTRKAVALLQGKLERVYSSARTYVPSSVSSQLYPSSAVRNGLSNGENGRLSPCSDSSDIEKRQPSFPGNRDIIDSRFLSASPSPPTQHSAELETPSPVSDAGSVDFACIYYLSDGTYQFS